MKKPFWSVVILMITIALFDLIIFEWWLPKRFTYLLEEKLEVGQLSFDDVELNWLNGRLIGGKGSNLQWHLSLGECRFTYSLFDLVFNNNFRFKDLKLRDFKIEELSESSSNQSIWNYFEELRKSPLDLVFDSIEVSGNFKTGINSFPFSFFTTKTNSNSKILFALELRMVKTFSLLGNLVPINKPLFLKGSIERETKKNHLAITLLLEAKEIGRFSYTGNEGSELIEFISDSKMRNSEIIKMSAYRKRGEKTFNGIWNSSFSSQDLVGRFPVLSIVEFEIEGGGALSFDSMFRTVKIDGSTTFKIASKFFPKEGILRGILKGKICLSYNKWLLEELDLLIENDKKEEIELKAFPFLLKVPNKGRFNFKFNELRVGRFERYFSKEARISGEFNCEIRDKDLIFNSKRFCFSDNLYVEQNVSTVLKIPHFLDFPNNENLNFNIKIPGKVDYLSDFLHNTNRPKKGLSFQNMKVNGFLDKRGWNVESGSMEITDIDEVKIGHLEVEHSFTVFFEENILKWLSTNIQNRKKIRVSTIDIDREIFFTTEDLRFSGIIRNLTGGIIFENSKPSFIAENLMISGALKYKGNDFLNKINIHGELLYAPKSKVYDFFQINNFKLLSENREMVNGELSFSLDKDFQLIGIESKDLELSFDSILDFMKFNTKGLNTTKIKINKLNWKLNGREELKIDALIRRVSSNKDKVHEIPLKWTFVRNEKEVSQWVKFSYKKDFESDLQINFQSDSNLISLQADILNLNDLELLFEDFLGERFQSIENNFFLLIKKLNYKSKLIVKTLIINPEIKLRNFRAVYNFNKSISFNFNIKNSRIAGELKFRSLDDNSTDIPNLNFTIKGEDTNATFLNKILTNNYFKDGTFSWEIEGKRTLNEGLELNLESKFKNLELNILGDRRNENESLLKAYMEGSLGRVFSWSPEKSKLVETLNILLQKIIIDEGLLKLNRVKSGEWRFFLENWKSPELNFFARGQVSSDGIWKINLFPSVKGRWEGLLEVANLLAAGKVRSGYRTLREEPLVLERSKLGWNFLNWWKLFAQGVGLEPND